MPSCGKPGPADAGGDADGLRIEVEHGVAVVRLDRPDAMHAIDARLRASLTRALPALDADPGVDAIVLTGSGDRAFCAGQDLDDAVGRRRGTLAVWLDRRRAVWRAVRGGVKAGGAAGNGVAAGAGFQLALLCDLRVAHAGARLGQPEVKAGLASIVGSWMMTLQIGQSANQQLSLTGELVDGERAWQLGLVNELVDRDAVLPTALARARGLADLPQAALRATKRRFRESTQAGFDDACAAALRHQRECFDSGEPQRAMRAFLDRRRR
ncbi:MAG: enoyl-CoA hydratase/isomerase family protein [Lautropia sp.]